MPKPILALATSAALLVVASVQAHAQTVYAQAPVQQVTPVAYQGRPNMGGGFLEFLFSGGAQPPQGYYQRRGYEPQSYAPQQQSYEPVAPAQPGMDPKFEKQAVAYQTTESPGTIVIDTEAKFLYLVEGEGRALRYGIGVGKPGFEWAGVKHVSAKREWPDWTPPADMLRRRPDLPRHMEGGPENPLGARAMYLGSSLYRIHGSNEPWTIGTAVSSGCIRMRNEDVIDLYERVKVGAKVIVS
jgi:lipoprotein-anchoring transpeptidase ErfK/SrfK